MLLTEIKNYALRYLTDECMIFTDEIKFAVFQADKISGTKPIHFFIFDPENNYTWDLKP